MFSESFHLARGSYGGTLWRARTRAAGVMLSKIMNEFDTVVATIFVGVVVAVLLYAMKNPPPPKSAEPDKSVIDHIKARRSIFPKDYSGEDVPREALEKALEAATWAPTHGKTEPWRFVVLGREGVRTLMDIKRTESSKLLKDDPKALEAFLCKMDKKAKDMAKCSHIVAIGVKRVHNGKGALMPEWEETAAVACAVQNFHIALQSLGNGYCGYWSSDGVGKWADSAAAKEYLGFDGSTDGEPDKIIGFFRVGVCHTIDKYRAKRAPISEKVAFFD